jgi:plastocyanin
LIQAGSNGQNVFTPSSVTVSKGSRVTWKFNGPHNVLGKGKGWHPGIKLRGTWSRTFRTAGKFSYRCTIHPGMNGKVIVR